MFTSFNHVGVVVSNADETAEEMCKKLGAAIIARNDFPEANQLSVEISIGEGRLELMSPLERGYGGTVDKYLDTHGEGLHHISLRPEKFGDDVKDLENRGVKVFGHACIQDRNIAFTHPKTTSGILFEILEEEKS